jgi:hypothetical protein
VVADGKNIAFVSDMSGEDQVYLVAQDGQRAGSPDHDQRWPTRQSALGAGRQAPAVGNKDGKVLVVFGRGEEDDGGGGRRVRFGDRLRLLPGRQWLAFSLSNWNGNNSLASGASPTESCGA